jgi:hypothetical protein
MRHGANILGFDNKSTHSSFFWKSILGNSFLYLFNDVVALFKLPNKLEVAAR